MTGIKDKLHELIDDGEDGDNKLPEELEGRDIDDYSAVPDDEIDQPDPNVVEDQ